MPRTGRIKKLGSESRAGIRGGKGADSGSRGSGGKSWVRVEPRDLVVFFLGALAAAALGTPKHRAVKQVQSETEPGASEAAPYTLQGTTTTTAHPKHAANGLKPNNNFQVPASDLGEDSSGNRDSSLNGGWRYSSDPCTSKKGLVFQITQKDRQRGKLSKKRIEKATNAFKRCGVVVFEGAVSESVTRAFRSALEADIEPILNSRARIRNLLKSSMRNMGSPKQVWETNASGIQEELFLTSANTFRERNDGRIDIKVEAEGAYASEQLTANRYVFPVLLRILGESLELKSLHAIQALGIGEGTSRKPQHWHRDTGLLFPNDDHFHISDVHNKTNGVHLPTYAINQFIPLVDFTESNGPTQFTLGSHQWGTKWSDDENEDVIDAKFYTKEGSIILMDYRTVHRGTYNKSPMRRPVGMLIWGRDWWSDTINYPTKCSASRDDSHQLSRGGDRMVENLSPGLRQYAARAIAGIFDKQTHSQACGKASMKLRRRNFFSVCVNAWAESLGEELRREIV